VLGCTAPGVAVLQSVRSARWSRSSGLQGISFQVWAGQRVARTVSVAVRVDRRREGRGYGHIADSVAADDTVCQHSRRSRALWRCRQERTVKPSAQPTLVRTQHLPPPAKTAPWLRERRPAGRFLLVTPRIRLCHRGSMRGSGYEHIADSVRAKLAVRITARFAI
jgi:hypothetical protein